MAETAEARLKRMRMRSWRRGTKEMDLVLGPFADLRLADMDAVRLEEYDRLLEENDQDLMNWLIGLAEPPDWAQPLMVEIGAFARNRMARD